jgi:UDP-N-acetylglucosamine 2-epimerase (non-hydrolysing)
VLVLRKVTERPAVLKGGTVKLVGTLTERIVHETSQLLDDPDAYARMAQVLPRSVTAMPASALPSA